MKCYTVYMRVLVIGTDLQLLDPSSGTTRRILEYAKTIGELDILLLLGESRDEKMLELPHLRIYPICGKFSRFWRGYFLARKLIHIKRYDVISAQDTEKSLIAWLLSFEYRIPWQMQIHTDIFSPHFKKNSFTDQIRFQLAKFFIPRATGVRVVSHRIKQSIERLGIQGKSKISILPIYLDVEKIRSAPVKIDLHTKYPGKFIMLMPTRLSREKNIGMAFEALVHLRKSGIQKEILLLIVGKGPDKQALVAKVNDMDLTELVKFEDWTDDPPSYYKTADVYLLTSVYEGGARAPLEAIAAGLPVVMSDVPPAHEEIQGGVNGLIVPVDDSRALAVAIEQLLTDDTLLKKIKDGAAASLHSTISKDDYLALYKKLLTDLL